MSAKSKDLLEVVNGYEIVNVDKMYNISDGIVDDGGLSVDDIARDESDAGNDSALLQETCERSVAAESTLEETSDELELDENNLIRFLEKDDIVSSFIAIFEDASEEEKFSLFERILAPAGAAVQDRLMTHLFRTVQKRKFGKQTESKSSDVKITEKVAAEILKKAKPPPGPFRPSSSCPPGPPGPSSCPPPPPAPPAPQVAKKSTTRPRPPMSLLVCDCRVYRTTSQEKLKNHIEAVHGGISHHEWQTCGECDHRFKFWDDLKVHIGKDHNPSKLNEHPCTTCRRKFQSLADIQLHREEEQACRLECRKCPDRFISERDLTNHMFQHF